MNRKGFCLLLARGGRACCRLLHRNSTAVSEVRGFHLALDADHLGGFVGGVGSDGHRLVDWADALGVVLHRDRRRVARSDGRLLALRNGATARALATRNDEWLSAAVGHCEFTRAVGALLKLATITGEERFKEAADKTLTHFGDRLKNIPAGLPYMLMTADFALEHPNRVVITADPSSSRARELIRAAHSVYQPNKVVLGTAGKVEEFARGLGGDNGEPDMVYICKDAHCELPTADREKIHELLIK